MDTGYEHKTENHDYYIFEVARIHESMIFLCCMWRFSKWNQQKTK